MRMNHFVRIFPSLFKFVIRFEEIFERKKLQVKNFEKNSEIIFIRVSDMI